MNMNRPRRTRRWVCLAAAQVGAAVAGLGAAACGVSGLASGAPAAKAPRAVTLQWWSDFDVTFKSQLDAAVSRFRQQYPQISVDLQIIAGSEYYPKLQTAAVAGAMAPVMDIESRAAAQFIRGMKGTLTDFDPLAKRDKYDLADYWPLEMPGFSDEKGHAYVLPYDISCPLLYYNRTLLQQAGIAPPDAKWTLDTLLDAAKKLTRTGADGRITQFGYDGFQGGGQFEFEIQRFGGSLLDDKMTTCTLNSAACVSAVQWWIDLRHKYHVAPLPAELSQLSGSEKAFGNAETAMWISGTPTKQRLLNYSVDWDIAGVPAGPKGDQLTSGGGGWSVAAKNDAPDESWLLVKYLSSEDNLAAMIGRSGWSVPARKSVVDSSYDPSRPPKSWPLVYKEVEKAKAITFSLLVRAADILSEVNGGLTALWNTGGEVKSALDQITTKVNAILASSSK